MREFCDALMATERRAQEREKRLADTERLLAESRAREARGETREGYDQLKARLGPNFGLSGGSEPVAADPRGNVIVRGNRRVLETSGMDMSKEIPVSPMLVEVMRRQTGREL